MKIYKFDSHINVSKVEIQDKEFGEILNLIHACSNELKAKGIDFKDITIAFSELFVRFFEEYSMKYFSLNPYLEAFKNGSLKLFGIKCIPNYENNVVVFCDYFWHHQNENDLVIKIECEKLFAQSKV